LISTFTPAEFPPLGTPRCSPTTPLDYSSLTFHCRPSPQQLVQGASPSSPHNLVTQSKFPMASPRRHRSQLEPLTPPALPVFNTSAQFNYVKGLYVLPSPRMSPAKPTPTPTPARAKSKRSILPTPRATRQRTAPKPLVQQQRCSSILHTLFTAWSYSATVITLTPAASAVLIALPLLPTMMPLMVALIALAESLELLTEAARRLVQISLFNANTLVRTSIPPQLTPARLAR
jgi:hypothetical protein